MATELGIEDRRAREAELLSEKGFMSLSELVAHVGVSESTVRRDLEILEEQGLIRRTHGGAVYVKDLRAIGWRSRTGRRRPRRRSRRSPRPWRR